MKKYYILLAVLIFNYNTYAFDTLQAPIPINDGPYVSIENDTTVLVQYISQDSMIEFKAYGNESISFDGRGFDRSNSYKIVTNHITPSIVTKNVSRMFVYSDMMVNMNICASYCKTIIL